MEKGAKALVYLLLGSLILGLMVILFHPMYRQAAVSIFKGQPETSPIWQSNQNYYNDVALTPDEEGHAE